MNHALLKAANALAEKMKAIEYAIDHLPRVKIDYWNNGAGFTRDNLQMDAELKECEEVIGTLLLKKLENRLLILKKEFAVLEDTTYCDASDDDDEEDHKPAKRARS